MQATTSERLVAPLGDRIIDGQQLSQVELAGYRFGQPLGEAPIVLIVPPVTRSPTPRSTGIASPLTMDSSIELEPDTT